jgi:hypothetical protein
MVYNPMGGGLVGSGMPSALFNPSRNKRGGIVLATSLDELAALADPMQGIIDLMVHNVQPHFMWIGNEADGATELGGSGLDLVNLNDSVEQQQASAKLNSQSTCRFSQTTDNLRVAHSADMEIRTGHFAWISIRSFDSSNTQYAGGKWSANNFKGYYSLIDSGQCRRFAVNGTTGNINARQCGRDNSRPAVDLMRRIAGDSLSISSRVGETSINDTSGDINGGVSSFNIGQGDPQGGSAIGNWGLDALWFGDPGADITETMRANLEVGLNLHEE